MLYSAICSKQWLFFKIYNASFGAWVPVLRVTCVLDLTDQKRYVTKLNKFGWSLCLETLQKWFQALIYTKPYNYLSKIFKQTSLFQFCFVLLFSEQEVTIHGLGSAINRAINLALQLEQRGQGTVEVTWKNSFFKLLIGNLLEREHFLTQGEWHLWKGKNKTQVTGHRWWIAGHEAQVRGQGSWLTITCQERIAEAVAFKSSVLQQCNRWQWPLTFDWWCRTCV